MRAACIDIGSNTTRLLVAERLVGGGLRELVAERAFTWVGRELIDGNRIGPAKIDEVAGVVGAQLSVARAHGVAEVRGVATAAIRRAVNGGRLVAAIRATTGLEVEILSDREEARLAFVGAAGMLERAPGGPLGVIDVGGGSSEVVVGAAPRHVTWWASLPVGSGILAARRLRSDPPAAAELSAARGDVAEVVAGLQAPPMSVAVAVGGSAASLCRLTGSVLSSETLTRALEVLAAEPSAAVAARLEIDPRRVRLLPAGLLILEAITARLPAEVTVGRGGIREGVLLEAGGG